MQSNTLTYSIIIPVFNSANILDALCMQIHQNLAIIGASYEIVLVNDCSTDSSWKVIQQMQCHNAQRILGINKTQNTGQHHTLYIGMLYAQGSYFITIDDDLQFLPSEIALLIKEQQRTNAQLVYGYPRTRQHSMLRNIASKLALYAFCTLLKTHSNGSPFRLFDARIFHPSTLAAPLILIDAIITPNTSKISTIPVSHQPRYSGSSGHKLYTQGLWALLLLYAYSSSSKKKFVYPIVILSIGGISLWLSIYWGFLLAAPLLTLFILLLLIHSYCIYQYNKINRQSTVSHHDTIELTKL